ncbi:hypothetical protein ACN4EE_12500 [Geminocystis sp. CENA526]|uniref:hypothetical protein n=1 Tax=Geminocystis sp. CENA526 TaxID=1355871 RepID=UPI003D6FCB1C
MNSYDKIKDLIEKKKLSQGLLFALSNSLKIKLTTRTEDQDIISSIETEIDLIKGLNTQINDQSLLTQKSYAINFHKQQLDNIYDIWDKNRETLVKIFQIINGSSIELESLGYADEDLNQSAEDFADEVEEENALFEEESIEEENSFFEDESIDEKDSENFDNETSENWIDDLDNDMEDSFSTEEETEDESFEMGEEEEIISTSDDDIVEEEESPEGDWDDLMDEMPEAEAIVSEAIAMDSEGVSPDLETNDDDWEEWLEDDDNISNHNGELPPDSIDWNEENWQEEEIS